MPLALLLAAIPPARSADADSSAPAARQPLSTARQVAELAVEEAQQRFPVQLRGVVTYCDPGWSMLFVQDETGGLRVDLGGQAVELMPGQRVEVSGVTAPGRYRPTVIKPAFRVLEQTTIFAPKPAELAEVAKGRADSEWIEVRGRVRSVGEDQGRLTLTLAEGTQRVKALVLNLRQEGNQEYRGARVRVRGVGATLADDGRQPTGGQLYVPSVAEVVVEEAGPVDPYNLPIQDIRLASEGGASRSPDGRIRLRGVVVDFKPGESLALRDGTGTLVCQTVVRNLAPPGCVVDLVGFYDPTQPETVVEDAIFRRIGLEASPLFFRPGQQSAASLSGPVLPLFRDVKPVRELSKAEAERGYAFRSRGVITYYDPDWNMMFFQDDTAGVYVDVGDVRLELRHGDLALLHGYSGPGDFAPIIRRPRFEILGQAPMPPAREAPLEELFSGKQDSQWIETRGLVRGMTNGSGHLWLELGAGKRRFRALIPQFGNQAMPTHLLDAKVSLRGVCGTVFNRNRQLLGIQLFVPSLNQVRVEEAPRLDPLAEAAQPIRSLLQFRPQDEGGHRRRVRGTVTLRRGPNLLFIQDVTGGVFVQAQEVPELKTGDVVDVVGFPEVGEYTPVLQNAQVHRYGAGVAPSAARVTAAQALGSNSENQLYDACLVEIEAYLLDRLETSTDHVLILRQGQQIFNAHLERASAGKRLPSIPENSLVRLTGVCSVQVDENRQPRAFRILLRSSQDVQVMQQPPWWTPDRIQMALLVMSAGAVGVVAWLGALQVRVRKQTAIIQQRLESEAALEKRYEDLFENANDVVFTTDLEGHVTSINRAAERLTGYNRRKDLPIDISRIVAPEFMPLVQEMIARKLKGEMPPPYGVQILTQDGGRVDLEINTRLIFKDGKHVGAQGIGRDITERKRAARELESSLSLLHATLESTADGILVVNSTGQVVGFNRRFQKMWRLPDEIIAGRDDNKALEFVLDQLTNPGSFLEKVRHLYQHPEAESLDVLDFKDGRVFERYSQAQRVGGQVVGRVWSFRDVTEQKRVETARRASEARKSAILESALDGVLTVDQEGAILESNQAAARAFGYARHDLQGRRLSDLLAPAAPADASQPELPFGPMIGAGHLLNRRLETVARRADASEFPVELSVTPIPGDGPPLFTAVIRDITERLDLEAQLRHAQKLESVGQLAAGVAHDFNNILGIIQGYASLLLARPQKDSELDEPLRAISTAAERAANLTRQLLTFSRKQIMQPKVVDLASVVSNVIKLLHRVLGEDVALQFNAPGALPAVRADVGMIEQVIMNLAVNARDAMPKGGRLSLSLAQAIIRESAVRRNPEARPGTFVCLTVSDTGCGMDAATLSRVFEPFFTTKDVGKGTGLGLATVYGIVKQHDGWIEVASQPGHGATFSIFLPATDQVPAPVAGKPRPTPPPNGQETVLIVEDEPALRTLAVRILERYGYRVFSAASGQDALGIWAREASRIDLLLTDMVMPGGMSGAELANRIREQSPQLKVIYTSGYSLEMVGPDRMWRDGAKFVPKPYTPVALAQVVRETLDGVSPVHSST